LWRNCRPISRSSQYMRLAFTRQPSRRSADGHSARGSPRLP
jgi:hypothetical protein